MFNRNETAWDRHQGLYMAADMAGGAPAPEWTPEMRAAMEKVLPKDVASFVKSLIPMVGSQAWIFMGKAVNPLQGKLTVDMEQARLAVEVVGVLLEKVDRFLTDEERDHVEATGHGPQAQLRPVASRPRLKRGGRG